MAQLFGLDVKTPEEIAAERNQQFQQAKLSRDPNVVARAAAQQSIFGIFGDPELKKARATQTALTDSVGGLEQEAGETAADFGIRQAKAAREALAGVNPEAALQANNQIIALQQEKLEQEKLKVGNERDRLDLNEAQKLAIRAGKRAVFATGADGKTIPVKYFGEEATDQEIAEQVAAMRAENPDMQFDLGTGLDAYKLDGRLTAGSLRARKNKSAEDKEFAGLTAAKVLNTDLKDLLVTLRRSPLALERNSEVLATAGADLQNFTDRVREEFFGQFETEGQAAVARQDAERVESRVDEIWANVSGEGRISSEARAQVLGLAYQLAKTLDPGGRLSDQDVEMAARMLIGNGDPEVIVSLMKKRIARTHIGLEALLDEADAGYIRGDTGVKEADRYRQSKDAVEQELREFVDFMVERREGFQRLQEGGKATPTEQKSAPDLSPEQQQDLDFFNEFVGGS